MYSKSVWLAPEDGETLLSVLPIKWCPCSVAPAQFRVQRAAGVSARIQFPPRPSSSRSHSKHAQSARLVLQTQDAVGDSFQMAGEPHPDVFNVPARERHVYIGHVEEEFYTLDARPSCLSGSWSNHDSSSVMKHQPPNRSLDRFSPVGHLPRSQFILTIKRIILRKGCKWCKPAEALLQQSKQP